MTKRKLNPKPAGRPEIYTDELGERFCEALESSPRGIKFICETRPDLPSEKTISDWLRGEKYPLFSRRYAQARAKQADFISDEIVDVAYKSQADKTGKVEVDKLKLDALKWKAKVLQPRKYCDKPELFLIEADKAAQSDSLTEEERIAKLTGIFEGAKKRGAKDNSDK